MQKKRILIVIAAGAALCALGALLSAAVIKSKTVRVAFYGVEKEIQDGVKSEIGNMNLGRVRYFELDDSAALPLGVEKKYSLLVAKNSLALKQRAKNFVPVGQGVMEALPISVRKSTLADGANYALPILLDHFEISYFEPGRKTLGLEIPNNYGALLRYLEAAKKEYEIPLLCAGGNDKGLLGFASAMSEILYGADEYKKMLELVRESSAMNKNTLPESLTRVLDEIRAMQEKGLLFPKWTKTSLNDIRYFMREGKVAAAAMFLSDRRKIEFNLIKYYSDSFFPRYDNQAEHGIIAPQIVAVLLASKNNAPLILGQLSSSSAQENLTNISLLAPTAARAEAVDRQADDVRFWAASSSAGALGGIEDECDVSRERLRALAQRIRVYLER